jgi:hypothetical protein
VNGTNAPSVSPARPETMRADASWASPARPARVRACGVCGAKFAPSRKWQDFCSDKCRKLAWRIRRRLDTPADIRATLNRIESKLDQIIKGE